MDDSKVKELTLAYAAASKKADSLYQRKELLRTQLNELTEKSTLAWHEADKAQEALLSAIRAQNDG